MTGLANSGIKETKEALAAAVEEIAELQDAITTIFNALVSENTDAAKHIAKKALEEK